VARHLDNHVRVSAVVDCPVGELVSIVRRCVDCVVLAIEEGEWYATAAAEGCGIRIALIAHGQCNPHPGLLHDAAVDHGRTADDRAIAELCDYVEGRRQSLRHLLVHRIQGCRSSCGYYFIAQKRTIRKVPELQRAVRVGYDDVARAGVEV
jgi:hypothetical protein